MDKTLVIAEIGVNHNRNIELAKQMIDAAKEAGADVVKFQTGIAEQVISRYADKAEYQKVTTGAEESQLEMCRKLLFPLEVFRELKEYCEDKRIEFLSTPFDLTSIEYLEQLGMKRWKVPSGEITNLPYLIRIAKTKKPVILSTGMADLQEVEAAVTVLKQYGCEKISLLHCTTEYPALYEDVNLKAMDTLQEVFQEEVGYSDHTQGIAVSIAAVARGARIIEKHFTIDQNLPGPDQKASLEPKEFKEMVQAIRNIELAMGDGVKKPSEIEKKNRVAARKSIVAARPIRQGEIFTEENLTVKRPGNGISPMEWNDVIGKTAKRNYQEDERIER